MTAKSFILHGFLAFAITLFSVADADAARVRKVKGKRVIINTEGDRVKKGDLFYVMSASGKRKGIIKIRKVKGKSALGYLGRGKASKGDDLVARNRKDRKKGQTLARTGAPEAGGPSGSYWGLMAGVSSNTSDVQLVKNDGSNGDKVALDGQGFSFKVFFDYPLLDWLWFRGLTGVEQFSVSGANDSDNLCEGSCDADITYLTGDFWGRIPLFGQSFKVWVGAGFNLLFPLSKSSSALDEGSITNTSIIGAGLGADWFLSRDSFIPVSFEYGLYPSSDQVDANAIFIRVGYGMSW